MRRRFDEAERQWGEIEALHGAQPERGRYYVAGEPLREVRDRLPAARTVLKDPYPQLLAQIRIALP